ncbi:unnamed protein product [Miscanthus lutarioriparius]|uniref:DUS-like FMN-binding domain-containing protein n=1 Tax=Miscanthus lutarioriparius TaxID=422564 RepID=A0A811QUN6_9POAL|nr:unnamed protein product [Miscanthus lutarioriparius]
MEYRDKLVLAPMVRVGTLPFRLLAAEYGADITYGEEIIDHKLLKCERVTNESLGTTDFVEKGTDSVVFRTCPEERGRVVFQMGTSNAVRALKAAQLVCQDVSAIDINMGCPKSFLLSGGMGAALLSKPELIHDILTRLLRNLDTTVTCKIRLLNTPKDTVELARRIEKTGVPALAVHGRKIKDRPRDPAKWDEIADVVSALSIPVIANGDVFGYEDFKRIKDATGAASIMVARGAMWNASIFCGGVPSAESFRSVQGLGKGVSGKPYPRLCNARRPRLEPGTFRSQAVRLYRLHQARLYLLCQRKNTLGGCQERVCKKEHIVGQRCEEHETCLERNDNALFFSLNCLRGKLLLGFLSHFLLMGLGGICPATKENEICHFGAVWT